MPKQLRDDKGTQIDVNIYYTYIGHSKTTEYNPIQATFTDKPTYIELQLPSSRVKKRGDNL